MARSLPDNTASVSHAHPIRGLTHMGKNTWKCDSVISVKICSQLCRHAHMLPYAQLLVFHQHQGLSPRQFPHGEVAPRASVLWLIRSLCCGKRTRSCMKLASANLQTSLCDTWENQQMGSGKNKALLQWSNPLITSFFFHNLLDFPFGLTCDTQDPLHFNQEVGVGGHMLTGQGNATAGPSTCVLQKTWRKGVAISAAMM